MYIYIYKHWLYIYVLYWFSSDVSAEMHVPLCVACTHNLNSNPFPKTNPVRWDLKKKVQRWNRRDEVSLKANKTNKINNKTTNKQHGVRIENVLSRGHCVGWGATPREWGNSTKTAASRSGSLPPSGADVRSADDAIAFTGWWSLVMTHGARTWPGGRMWFSSQTSKCKHLI